MVANPNKSAIKSNASGMIATKIITKEQKYHNKEYLIGIRPLRTTVVVTTHNTNAKISNEIRNVTVIIYTS